MIEPVRYLWEHIVDAAVIDTLRLADRLKEAGLETPSAEGLARALGEELGDRVLTAHDRDAFSLRVDGLDTKFDAKFDNLEAKFSAQHNAHKVQIESLGTHFKLLLAVVGIGFSALIGLGLYDVLAP